MALPARRFTDTRGKPAAAAALAVRAGEANIRSFEAEYQESRRGASRAAACAAARVDIDPMRLNERLTTHAEDFFTKSTPARFADVVNNCREAGESENANSISTQPLSFGGGC